MVYRGRLLSAESVRRLRSRRASDVTVPLLADLGALGVLDPVLDDGLAVYASATSATS